MNFYQVNATRCIKSGYIDWRFQVDRALEVDQSCLMVREKSQDSRGLLTRKASDFRMQECCRVMIFHACEGQGSQLGGIPLSLIDET
jgi:hypothetical protein